MKIYMKSGRSFSREFGTDAAQDTSASFIINEELESIMNKEEIIGTQMHFMGFHGPVIGVMENYHFQSVRNSIEPLAIIVAPPSYLNFITIRMKSGNISDNIKEVENSWNEIMPQYPFDFKFVDQEFDQMYRSEARMSDLMKYFTIIAIVIACVGLFGLSAFAAEQKTREIGIRKAMGANIPSILILFSREFVWLLMISALVSWPLSWFVLKNWLQNFGYRTELSVWIFIFSGLAALIIALISISYQAVKAARTNPAITLKYE
jgi:ABC-type antimicrobial peptide transport system permease subunit